MIMALASRQIPLAGMNYDQLEKLFLSGQLEGRAKDLFETLQRLKEEGVNIDKALADAKKELNESLTGTTAADIASMIADGFGQGLRTVREFAGKTEDLVRKAMLKALELRALEGPIQKIYDKFAEDAASNGGLDQGEIADFTKSINATIENAAKFAAELEKATGIKLAGLESTNAAQNTMTSAIRGMTEQQADLLAGQFGGQRLATLQLVDLTKNVISIMTDVRNNTANIFVEMRKLNDRFNDYEIGTKKLHIA
jgi:hypothetical protein